MTIFARSYESIRYIDCIHEAVAGIFEIKYRTRESKIFLYDICGCRLNDILTCRGEYQQVNFIPLYIALPECLSCCLCCEIRGVLSLVDKVPSHDSSHLKYEPTRDTWEGESNAIFYLMCRAYILWEYVTYGADDTLMHGG